MEGDAELVSVKPLHVGIWIELADVTAETHVEHDAPADISLYQYESG
jgi:hypothetical protein